MASELYKISSGMNLQLMMQEKSAINLAGASIPGFKGEHVISKSFNNELASAVGSENELGGADAPTSFVDFGQGSLKPTNRPLDFAINGKGFFQVQTSGDKMLLTRNGAFHTDQTGNLITQEGHSVLDRSGRPVRFGASDDISSMAVDKEGNLTVNDANGNSKSVTKLGIVTVENPQAMARLSANYFLVNDGTKTAKSEAKLFNRSLEQANVSPIKQMSHMIESVRVFEMSQKIMQMQNELARSEQSKLRL